MVRKPAGQADFWSALVMEMQGVGVLGLFTPEWVVKFLEKKNLISKSEVGRVNGIHLTACLRLIG